MYIHTYIYIYIYTLVILYYIVPNFVILQLYYITLYTYTDIFQIRHCVQNYKIEVFRPRDDDSARARRCTGSNDRFE